MPYSERPSEFPAALKGRRDGGTLSGGTLWKRAKELAYCPVGK